MCLYPIYIKNPRYIPNKKNGGNPPKADDKRKLYVPVGCGKCIECRRQLSNNWKIRLSEELDSLTREHTQVHAGTREHTHADARRDLPNLKAYYITLTFSEEKLNWYQSICERYTNINDVVAVAVRHFLERWRRKYTTSLRHWLITELGHENTERIHLHGIVFTTEDKIKTLNERWGNGFIRIGQYCNQKTINYIVKYITKIDNDHQEYEPKIFCSAGIGSNYIYTINGRKEKTDGRGIKFNKYNGEETREYYLTKKGFKLALPMYYRNYIYTEEEKEKLWIQKLNKQEKYVDKVKYELKTDEDIKNYLNALKTAQKNNIKNGYGQRKYKEQEYEKLLIKLRKKEDMQ